MKKTTSLRQTVKAGIITLFLSVSLQAHAESPIEPPFPIKPPAPSLFMQYDLNGDGMITPDELKLTRMGMFKAADEDADGSLSLKEFIAMEEMQRLERMKHLFAFMDKDGDGIVDKDEFLATFPGDDETGAALFERISAGKGEVDLEAFMSAQLNEGPIDDDLLWKFARLDRDGDALLNMYEFAGIGGFPVIEPPVEPELPVIIDPVTPDPNDKIFKRIADLEGKLEKTLHRMGEIDEKLSETDNEGKINRLTQKLERLELRAKKLAERIEKLKQKLES